MPRVLIVSGRGDWAAEQVAKRLETRGWAYSWLDPADFPRRVQVTARLDRGWCGEVETPDGIFSWEEISAVFYRRPRDFDMPRAMSGPEQRFARAQARVGLGGVLASLLRGMTSVPADQRWFWEPQWQAGERQASEQIKADNVEVFDDADAVFAALNG